MVSAGIMILCVLDPAWLLTLAQEPLSAREVKRASLLVSQVCRQLVAYIYDGYT